MRVWACVACSRVRLLGVQHSIGGALCAAVGELCKCVQSATADVALGAGVSNDHCATLDGIFDLTCCLLAFSCRLSSTLQQRVHPARAGVASTGEDGEVVVAGTHMCWVF